MYAEQRSQVAKQEAVEMEESQIIHLRPEPVKKLRVRPVVVEICNSPDVEAVLAAYAKQHRT